MRKNKDLPGLTDSLADQQQLSINFSQEEFFLLYAPGNNLFGSDDGGCSFLESIISLQRTSFYIKENPDVPDGNRSTQEVRTSIKERPNFI